MSISVILLYLLAGMGLYFLLNYMDKKCNDNYLNGIVWSVVYIIILAGIFSSYGIAVDNIFLIVIIELGVRLVIDSYIREIPFFKGNVSNQRKYVISIVINYLVNYYFINRVTNVFLDGNDIKIIVWGFIIFYLYKIFRNDFSGSKFKNSRFYFNKDREYVVMQYAKLKGKYFRVVRTRYRELVPLIYSIMIYENYNRGDILRSFDNFKYRINKGKGRYGIMQVYSNYPISDDKSIRLAIKRLERMYSKINDKGIFGRNIRYLLNKYYRTKVNIGKIIDIYNIIVSFDKI